MWNIDINPVLVTIGTMEIRWYGVMIVLAVVAAIGISLLEAKKEGLLTGCHLGRSPMGGHRRDCRRQAAAYY